MVSNSFLNQNNVDVIYVKTNAFWYLAAQLDWVWFWYGWLAEWVQDNDVAQLFKLDHSVPLEVWLLQLLAFLFLEVSALDEVTNLTRFEV